MIFIGGLLRADAPTWRTPIRVGYPVIPLFVEAADSVSLNTDLRCLAVELGADDYGQASVPVVVPEGPAGDPKKASNVKTSP